MALHLFFSDENHSYIGFMHCTTCFILRLKICVGFQALIQYQNRASAVTARTSLQVAFHLHGHGALRCLLILVESPASDEIWLKK